MRELDQPLRQEIYQTAQDISLDTLTIRDNTRLSITTIDQTLALTLKLQQLLIRLGATLPKQGLKQ